MSTVSAVRARLTAWWEFFLSLREQEEDRWRETIGESAAEKPAAETDSAACARPERPRPIEELVAERQQETATPAQSSPAAEPDAPPDLAALIAQRQEEHRRSSGEPHPKD